LGGTFFSPRSAALEFIDRALEEFARVAETSDNPVLFTGINTGGVLAKALALRTQCVGIAFLSFAVFDNYLMTGLPFEEDDSWWLINVHTVSGVFAVQEPQMSTNIAVPWIDSPSWLESTVFSSFIRDKVYKTFCTLVEMCSQPHFDPFCRAALGEDEFNVVKEGVKISW
jgi:hypothetical protein